jgi:hypothetical protein
MKRCPVCQSDYKDDSLRFCLNDGTPLENISPQRAQPQTLEIGAAKTVAPPPTEVLHANETLKFQQPQASKTNWLPWIIGGAALFIISIVALAILIPALIWLRSSGAESSDNANRGRSLTSNNSNANSNRNSGTSKRDLLTELPIRIGDPDSKVREIYKPSSGPDYNSDISSYYYHFPELGLWFFYDKNMRVRTIRIESPFKGAVDGIRIGDTEETVRSLKGAPARTTDGLQDNSTALIYDRSSVGTFIRFDVDNSTGRVVIIFL